MSDYTCSQCGTNNVEGSRFCAGCGSNLSAAPPQRPAAPLPPRPAPFPSPATPPPAPMPPPAEPRFPSAHPSRPTTSSYSGRAMASLILGITGFMFCGPFTAIPGIIVGKMELNAIRDGSSPKSNEGLTKAGFYISIAVTILYTLLLLVAIGAGLLPFLLNR